MDVSPRAVPDGLQHGALATSIVNHLRTLSPGSVIAVQGSWGRGKTDVLQRVHQVLQAASEAGAFPRPLWLRTITITELAARSG